MAGLPRSGSTVISALLNQNPKIYSGPPSPVLHAMFLLEQGLFEDEFFLANPKMDQVKKIISNVIVEFYNDVENSIIIDKNRAWTNKISYIQKYLNEKPKIICPVRDITEILSSIITLIKNHPYQEGHSKINFIDQSLIKLDIPITDDNRCDYIMEYGGFVGQSLSGINEVLKNKYSDFIHFVEYKDLLQDPQKTLNKIYDFLEQDYYEHDFENIKSTEYLNDFEIYGIKDLHRVRTRLECVSKNPEDVLSNYILEKYQNMNIWR